VQRRADVVEAVHRAVERQFVAEINVDAEQVAHRIVVFGAVQPAENHPALGGTLRLLGRIIASADPCSQCGALLCPGTWLSHRRHLICLDALEHA
jgi:hypothetical protein